MSDSYVHLHNHSSYSILDGAAKIEEMAEAAARDGQPALAITDHGNMYGLPKFYQACTDVGIKPILGMEAYFADDRTDRSPITRDGGSELDGSDKRYYHLTLLATTNEGYHNLIKISSDAFLEGFYYKPRCDWSTLERYSKGLIATSGCLGGPVLQPLLHDDYYGAAKAAARLHDIFGPSNFFIELQDHGLREQARTNPQLIDIAKRMSTKLIATNDLHYVNHEDHTSHDALLCCQTGAKISDQDRFKFASDQHYLKSAAEMRNLFRSVPGACDNTLEIASRVDVTLDFGTLHLPHFEVPEGFSDSSYLEALVAKGLDKRYGTPSEEAIERLRYELNVIDGMGLSSYFLIVWDIVRWADRQGIPRGQGRGSAAGSLVSYCLNITKVDPLRHNLFFERFLNPDRIAMPDIDLDFSPRDREYVINYIAEKYGHSNVAQIITFGGIKARTAVRDAARVLGHPPKLGDVISKQMPEPIMGVPTPLWACFEDTDRYHSGYQNASELREFYRTNSDAQEVIDVARGLEGLHRSDGVHPAGLLIAPVPLTDLVPIQRKGEDAPITTQYDMRACEDLGLLKMDILGLRNLDVIKDCLECLDDPPDLDSEEFKRFDDPATYALLRSGKTWGTFQMESAPMAELLMKVSPDNIEDLAAVIALYRPGPMGTNMHNDYADIKNGRKPATYIHPDAQEALAETYGLCVYQEEMMRLSQIFAGYSGAEADGLRKIVGKKLVDKVGAEREKFTNGCLERGYSEEIAEALFKIVEDSANYSFNKCLSGDTIVRRPMGGRYAKAEVSISELYAKTQEGRTPWMSKFKDPNRGVTILALDTDGRIRPKRIKDIIYNGRAEVFRVTLEDGRSIKATKNHRHLTEHGWRVVADLSVGDVMVTHGGFDPQKFTEHRTTVGERQLAGVVNGAYGVENYGYVDGGFVSLREWTESRGDTWYCDDCGISGVRLERAHIDGDRTNNDWGNLSLKCVSCHKKFDYKHNGRNKQWDIGHSTKLSAITSIEFCGVEDVYDIEMDFEGHNFIANGFVTHNSHALGYAYTAYHTAYLKEHYPVEYMAALCDSVAHDTERCASYIAEARNMGIEVLPPDVTIAQTNFTASEGRIVVGLDGIKYLGHDTAKKIVDQRDRTPFSSIEDFVFRCEPNLRELQFLILAGACDSFGSRLGLHSAAQELLEQARTRHKGKASKQISLFEEVEFWEIDVVDKEFEQLELLNKEKEALGLYVSGHPLNFFQDYRTEKSLGEVTTGKNTVLVTVMNVSKHKTRAGNVMGDIIVGDLTYTAPLKVWPKHWDRLESSLKEGACGTMEIEVREDLESGSRLLVCNDFTPISTKTTPSSAYNTVYLRLPRGFASNNLAVSKLKGLLLSHSGKHPVVVQISAKTELDMKHEYLVDWTDDLKAEIAALFARYSADKKLEAG